MHEQLDTITRSQTLITLANTSPNPSFVGVARTPLVSLPSNVRTLSSSNTTPPTFTNTLHYTVDISRAGDGEGNKLLADTIRAAVEKEI